KFCSSSSIFTITSCRRARNFSSSSIFTNHNHNYALTHTQSHTPALTLAKLSNAHAAAAVKSVQVRRRCVLSSLSRFASLFHPPGFSYCQSLPFLSRFNFAKQLLLFLPSCLGVRSRMNFSVKMLGRKLN
ncbi:hypothetical protein CICLE_v10033408mg, partial [Citrus x clementina]